MEAVNSLGPTPPLARGSGIRGAGNNGAMAAEADGSQPGSPATGKLEGGADGNGAKAATACAEVSDVLNYCGLLGDRLRRKAL